MTKTRLLVGSRVEVIPISPIGENAWSAKAVSLPEGWSCNLIHRASATIVSGKALIGWLLNAYTDQHHAEGT